MGQVRKTAGTSSLEVSSRFRLFPRVGHGVGQDKRQTNPRRTTPNRTMRKYPLYPFYMQNPSEVNSQGNSYKHNKSLAYFMQGFVNGGGEWIRTTEVVDNRFTVCPLWPLGNSPINYEILYKACPASSSGRTTQFGAGERTRTPDLLITNSVGGGFSATLRHFWAFPLHHSAAYDPEFSTVSTQFFRVWVRVWVR